VAVRRDRRVGGRRDGDADHRRLVSPASRRERLGGLGFVLASLGPATRHGSFAELLRAETLDGRFWPRAFEICAVGNNSCVRVSRAFLAAQHRRASCPARRDFAGGAFSSLARCGGYNHTNDRRLSAASARLSQACFHLPQMVWISLDKGQTFEVVCRRGCARRAFADGKPPSEQRRERNT
jgi:hypothetical protein